MLSTLYVDKDRGVPGDHLDDHWEIVGVTSGAKEGSRGHRAQLGSPSALARGPSAPARDPKAKVVAKGLQP